MNKSFNKFYNEYENKLIFFYYLNLTLKYMAKIDIKT